MSKKSSLSACLSLGFAERMWVILHGKEQSVSRTQQRHLLAPGLILHREAAAALRSAFIVLWFLK